jgi:hypothetical protein
MRNGRLWKLVALFTLGSASALGQITSVTADQAPLAGLRNHPAFHAARTGPYRAPSTARRNTF